MKKKPEFVKNPMITVGKFRIVADLMFVTEGGSDPEVAEIALTQQMKNYLIERLRTRGFEVFIAQSEIIQNGKTVRVGAGHIMTNY